ncbi:ribosomal silencing factor RsfS [Microbacterium nanhaiense]|uniref:Ribosomal silencing factor RsfS n=2 Tax=Microbacterium nanhaiense TaxID=1301026 RepID=A0ABQ2MZW6_9MICO|nr:ribosomal silencing factor RsfS [Microbacterium nanhaiense]
MRDSSLDMLQTAVNAADKMGGEDFVALDVSEPMPLADIFFIVTGRSERNVGAISDEIERELHKTGHKLLRREGKAGGRWILCDFGDLIVHVFHGEEREYYALERLWKDCPTVPFEMPTRPSVAGDFA